MIKCASKQGEVLRYVWSEDNPGVTVPTVAEKCELTVASTRYSLQVLEAAGLVRRDLGHTAIQVDYDIPGKFGPPALTRTPDVWWLTDAGLALVDAWMAEVADAH